MRLRTVDNVVDEIENVVTNFGIKNFFFQADTFTSAKEWVIGLCREIIERGLKIEWAANSRIDTLDDEMLDWMHSAGMWLIAIGYESGSIETLKKIKKGIANVGFMYAKTKMIREYKLKIYGFFIIGFPWEEKKHIRDTIAFAKKLKCDYYEIHIAAPYPDTELYGMSIQLNLLPPTIGDYDYFGKIVTRTRYLTSKQLLKLRKKAIAALIINPGYILRVLSRINSLKIFLNHLKFGVRALIHIVV